MQFIYPLRFILVLVLNNSFTIAAQVNGCEALYISKVNQVIAGLRSERPPITSYQIKEYLDLIHRQHELETKIQYIERNILDSSTISRLRTPSSLYTECKIGNGTSIPLEARSMSCQALYITAANQALESLRGHTFTIILQQAREYMELIKEQQDIENRIQQLERYGLTTNASSRLRLPSLAYYSCLTSIVNRVGASY
jgi:hypothetical protein